jgi:uncharacterized protein
MPSLPSRFRRLDGILADLPMDDPMLLSELDGYLTAIALCPAPPPPALWMPPIWDGAAGETVPFEDATDARLFGEMVAARYREIQRDLDREKPQPIFDIDERNGEVMWEIWIDGFAFGMEQQPERWAEAAGDDGAAVAELRTAIDVARDASDLDGEAINALCDVAPVRIVELLGRLHAAPAAVVAEVPAAKVGRNDPCPCGSGRKSKKCCAVG